MTDLGVQRERLLIFGGPYGNFAATRAMRQRAVELGVSPGRVICTGDLVAYCAEPAQTLELVRDWGIHVVMGNCEAALGFNEPDCGCGFDSGSQCSTLAVAWYRFADRHIDGEQRRWMRSLPRSIDFGFAGRRFRVVHGSPESINEFVFASSDPAARLAQLRRADVDAVIGGHSGIPFGQALGERYWLNAGVIGLPANDGGTHGWYMLVEPVADGLRCSWQQLDYDFDASRRSTIAAGMTEYGAALGSGLWPSMDILPAAERLQAGQPLDLRDLYIPAADECSPRKAAAS